MRMNTEHAAIPFAATFVQAAAWDSISRTEWMDAILRRSWGCAYALVTGDLRFAVTRQKARRKLRAELAPKSEVPPREGARVRRVTKR